MRTSRRAAVVAGLAALALLVPSGPALAAPQWRGGTSAGAVLTGGAGPGDGAVVLGLSTCC